MRSCGDQPATAPHKNVRAIPSWSDDQCAGLRAWLKDRRGSAYRPEEGLMRRFVVIPAVLLLFAAVMPAAASAQSAPDERARFTDEFVDEDFCGTGESVQVVENTVANVWGLEGEDTFKLTFRTRLTLTYGDRTLVEIDAGRVDVQRVEGTYP